MRRFNRTPVMSLLGSGTPMLVEGELEPQVEEQEYQAELGDEL